MSDRASDAIQMPEWVQAFLIRLAIGLNKTIAYPRGHPALEGELSSLAADLAERLRTTSALEIGVLRDRLIVGGAESESRHPLMSGLADRLHRHHIGGVRMTAGVRPTELAEFLGAVAERPENGPVGLAGPERTAAWPNIAIRPLAMGELSISREDGSTTPASAVWRALAASALQDAAGVENARGEDIGQAIARNLDNAEYLRDVAARLREIGPMLGAGGAGTDLARAVGALITQLDARGAQALLRAIREPAVRRRVALDVLTAVPADAVVPLVEGMAGASQVSISHTMLRLLTKLASQTHVPGPGGDLADHALRDVATRLVDNWTLPDPNPEDYRSLLMDLAGRQAAPARKSRTLEDPTVRIVCMALETGAFGKAVSDAVAVLIERKEFDMLVRMLEDNREAESVVSAIRDQIVASAALSEYLRSDAVSDEVIGRLVAWSGAALAERLLDALAAADSRTTRRRLLSTLQAMGNAIAPQVIRRLDHGEWYVKRNMLAILSEMDPPPAGFSALRYLDHPEARVRREALRIAVRLSDERTAALKRSLTDSSPHVVSAGLSAALADCPPEIVGDVIRLADDPATEADARERAIRVAGGSGQPVAVRWLLAKLRPPGWMFWRKLRSTPDLPVLIAALASARSSEPAALAALRAAAASRDPSVRAAAQ